MTQRPVPSDRVSPHAGRGQWFQRRQQGSVDTYYGGDSYPLYLGSYSDDLDFTLDRWSRSTPAGNEGGVQLSMVSRRLQRAGRAVRARVRCAGPTPHTIDAGDGRRRSDAADLPTPMVGEITRLDGSGCDGSSPCGDLTVIYLTNLATDDTTPAAKIGYRLTAGRRRWLHSTYPYAVEPIGYQRYVAALPGRPFRRHRLHPRSGRGRRRGQHKRATDGSRPR